jgi:hypothetical protein
LADEGQGKMLVGIFPESELDRFDTRRYEIEPSDAVNAPAAEVLIMAHVEQNHFDESGSKWRLMPVNVWEPGLTLNAFGQYIYPLVNRSSLKGGD